MSKPTKRVIGSTIISFQMTEYRAERFTDLLNMFIEAMKACRDLIEKDKKIGYIPIWNDETVWNKYLFENPPSVMLNQSYIYPDSLIQEYYIPMWGRDYPPKLVTLTKWFSTSQEGGEAVNQMIQK